MVRRAGDSSPASARHGVQPDASHGIQPDPLHGVQPGSRHGVRSGVEAGRVGRAHGLDGSFHVIGARPRLLREGVCVTIANHSRAITRRAGAPQRPIVRLQGIEDRAAAEALRGLALTVRRADAPPLDEDEWWASDLEGCAVVDGERHVGVVRRLIELPSCEALEVEPRPTPAKPLLIPMVRDAIRHVDLADGRIDVDMGFLGEG